MNRDSLPKLAADCSEPQLYIWCRVGLLEGGWRGRGIGGYISLVPRLPHKSLAGNKAVGPHMRVHSFMITAPSTCNLSACNSVVMNLLIFTHSLFLCTWHMSTNITINSSYEPSESPLQTIVQQHTVMCLVSCA